MIHLLNRWKRKVSRYGPAVIHIKIFAYKNMDKGEEFTFVVSYYSTIFFIHLVFNVVHFEVVAEHGFINQLKDMQLGRLFPLPPPPSLHLYHAEA